MPLLRDVGMYLCIVTSTLAICADGVSTAEGASCLLVRLLSTDLRVVAILCVQVITVWESCGFICVYVVYILLVVAKHSHGVRRKKRQAALQVRLHTISGHKFPI